MKNLNWKLIAIIAISYAVGNYVGISQQGKLNEQIKKEFTALRVLMQREGLVSPSNTRRTPANNPARPRQSLAPHQRSQAKLSPVPDPISVNSDQANEATPSRFPSAQ